jgi:hypothetical protein
MNFLPNPSSNYQQYDSLIPKDVLNNAKTAVLSYAVDKSGLKDYLNNLGINSDNIIKTTPNNSDNSNSDFSVSSYNPASAPATQFSSLGPVIPPTSQYSGGGISPGISSALGSLLG